MDFYYLVATIRDISSHADDGMVDCELFITEKDAMREIERRRTNGIMKVIMFKALSIGLADSGN